MSHFTVAIITKGMPTREVIEKALEPFDEDKDVLHYKSKEELINQKRKEIEDYKNGTYAEYLKDKEKYLEECKNKSHIKYITEEFPKKLEWTDEECYLDAIKYENEEDIMSDGSVRSTYNPLSKWDWYQIGGRWAGMLKVNAGNNDVGYGEKSWGWEDRNPYERGEENIQRVDIARVKDIITYDPDTYKGSIRFWELYIEGQEPQTEKEKEMIEWAYKKEYYIRKYGTKEKYAEIESTFHTWAIITKDGEWHEPGTMGWFACSSATTDEEVAFIENYKKVVFDNAEDDDYMTIVDCHI